MNNTYAIIINRKITKGVVAFIAITIAAVAVLNIYGEMDPAVNVKETRIEIKALYGANVDFEEIAGICLLEESMKDIGVGIRTNGFSGFGGALKGNFRAGDFGETLLFVYADSSPTIHIQRESGKDIFISFRDSARTVKLYDEIESAFINGDGIEAEVGSSKCRSRCVIRYDYLRGD